MTEEKAQVKTVICTSLNKIRARVPCEKGWKKLLDHLGKTKADDEPLPFSVIVESNGLDDALWACRTTPEYDHEWRLFAVWCARQVQHLMTYHQSVDALDVAYRHANGQATNEELHAAQNAAKDAARDAARDAYHKSVQDAAWAAAWAAARAARYAASAVAEYAGWVAWAAAKDAQTQKFLDVVSSARGEK